MIQRSSWLLAALTCLMFFVLGAAQAANQAALVVRFSEERVETYCVSFSEEEISGYELLERAGLPVEAQEVGMGASVCRVDDVGCAASNCFCQCRGGACEYWSYWQMRDGQWQYAVTGASISMAAHGDIQGWSWGPGSVTEATVPPLLTFEEVCNPDSARLESQATTTMGGDSPAPIAQATATTGLQDGAEVPATSVPGDETGLPLAYLGFGALVLVLMGLLLLTALRRRH